VKAPEVYGGLIPWVALHETGFGWLDFEGAGTEQATIPRLFSVRGKFVSTAGLLTARGACFLVRGAGGDGGERDAAFRLQLSGFGDSATLAERILARAREWDGGGRPQDPGVSRRSAVQAAARRDRRPEAVASPGPRLARRRPFVADPPAGRGPRSRSVYDERGRFSMRDGDRQDDPSRLCEGRE
jgi:hypothetical protein